MTNINLLTDNNNPELFLTEQVLPEQARVEIAEYFQGTQYMSFANLDSLRLYSSQSGGNYLVMNYMGACPLYSKNSEQLFVACDCDDPEAVLNASTVGPKYREFVAMTNTVAEILIRYGINIRLNVHFADMGIVLGDQFDRDGVSDELDNQFDFYSSYAAMNLAPEIEVGLSRYSQQGADFPMFIRRDVDGSFPAELMASLSQSLRIFYPFYVAYRLAAAEGNNQQGAAANMLRNVIKRRAMQIYTDVIIAFFDNIFDIEQASSLDYVSVSQNINRAIQNKKANTHGGMNPEDAELGMIAELETAINTDGESVVVRFGDLRVLQIKFYTEAIIQDYATRGVAFNRADRKNLADVIGVFGYEATLLIIQQYATFDTCQGEGQLHGFIERFSALLEVMNRINPNLQGNVPRLEINLMKMAQMSEA